MGNAIMNFVISSICGHYRFYIKGLKIDTLKFLRYEHYYIFLRNSISCVNSFLLRLDCILIQCIELFFVALLLKSIFYFFTMLKVKYHSSCPDRLRRTWHKLVVINQYKLLYVVGRNTSLDIYWRIKQSFNAQIRITAFYVMFYCNFFGKAICHFFMI